MLHKIPATIFLQKMATSVDNTAIGIYLYPKKKQ